jgi:hypothetical protein
MWMVISLLYLPVIMHAQSAAGDAFAPQPDTYAIAFDESASSGVHGLAPLQDLVFNKHLHSGTHVQEPAGVALECPAALAQTEPGAQHSQQGSQSIVFLKVAAQNLCAGERIASRQGHRSHGCVLCCYVLWCELLNCDVEPE